MPKAPSPQIKKLWNEFLRTEIPRPKFNTKSAICLICGTKYLNPRRSGDICPKCKKIKEEKVKTDDSTRKFLRRNPQIRRRFQY